MFWQPLLNVYALYVCMLPWYHAPQTVLNLGVWPPPVDDMNARYESATSHVMI